MEYFITYNDDKKMFQYGTLETGQYLATGLKNTYKTSVKNDFVNMLLTDFKIEYKDFELKAVEPKIETLILNNEKRK